MHLSTQSLFAPPDEGRYAEPVSTAAWAEVCKGLYGILAGYVMIFGAVVALVVVVVMTVFQAVSARPGEGAGGGIAFFIVGAIAAGLLVAGGFALIVRSQWRCLRNAPEHCGAKWWMFGAILCIVSGPGLGMVSSVAGAMEDAPAHAKADGRPLTPKTLREAVAQVKHVGVSPIKIAGSVIGLLSSVFFVLFLRSAALYFHDGVRARMAELYLLFIAALDAGFIALFVVPEAYLTSPMPLLLLGAGWALSGVWYLVLIVSTCACIQGNLSAPRSQIG